MRNLNEHIRQVCRHCDYVYEYPSIELGYAPGTIIKVVPITCPECRRKGL